MNEKLTLWIPLNVRELGTKSVVRVRYESDLGHSEFPISIHSCYLTSRKWDIELASLTFFKEEKILRLELSERNILTLFLKLFDVWYVFFDVEISIGRMEDLVMALSQMQDELDDHHSAMLVTTLKAARHLLQALQDIRLVNAKSS